MYKTALLKIKRDLINNKNIEIIEQTKAIKQAAELIVENEVVAFPTETVYGLGANALQEKAVLKIFEAKGRPTDNPLIVHISRREQLFKLIKGYILKVADKLIDEFWPGPLTIIFKKSSQVPQITTAGLETVAVRMPSHPIALALINQTELPLAAPSANSSGFPSPTSAEHVYSDLNGKIPLIIDGGICDIGLESTVVEIQSEQVNILRPGAITMEMIKKVVGNTHLVKTINHKEYVKPKSPGMKYKHYSPSTPLWIVKKDSSITKILKKNNINNEKTLIIVSSETLQNLKLNQIKARIKNLGSINDLNYIAKNLFKILRESDLEDFKLILIEEVSQKDIGIAVMNRLTKAATKII
ncbi:MAG: threonylcarbamoyl-AMP synthase [Halanaerobiales bacterium]|nr:threonylcarbamoyl-AMP synthase [Halanaerobiales bacterium]